ncbi:MAG: hypothetical protein Q9185_004764 [Variospora sp. 1 TL-2023]
MSSLHRKASTSSSRHPTQSKRSQAYRGMETVPEYEPLPNPPRSQQQIPDHRSTRLSGAEGQKLMVRSSHKQSTRASRHDDDDDEDVRGFSRKEVSFAEGGVLAHKHRSEGGGGGGSGRGESTFTSKSSRTQVPYNDEPSRRGDDRRRSTTAITGESSRRKTNNREDEEKTITRGGDRTVTRQDKERTITRSSTRGGGGGAQDYGYTEERTITRDDNDARALVPYGKERTMTRSKRAGDYDDYSNEDRTITRNDTRMVGPRLQTIREDERAKTRTKTSSPSHGSGPSTNDELKRRVEQLEDEKTRRLEKQVEKLGDQVAQLQMDKGKQAPVAVYAPVYAPGYPCDCEYCLYGRGGYPCRSRY